MQGAGATAVFQRSRGSAPGRHARPQAEAPHCRSDLSGPLQSRWSRGGWQLPLTQDWPASLTLTTGSCRDVGEMDPLVRKAHLAHRSVSVGDRGKDLGDSERPPPPLYHSLCTACACACVRTACVCVWVSRSSSFPVRV